ncbi:MAG: DMT family transporter [Bacteroidales bacterium]|mgnify:CR=1 FL=1|nr:DMT family transporter [Bacteroidales bacterium]HOI31352.1 DMT family transporter [Bacteroidales bacterium]
MKNRYLALAAAFVANLIYGINYVIAKGIMPEYLQPRSIILVRVTIAALLFWLLKPFTIAEHIQKIHLLRIAVAAFFGVAANQILFFEGLNLTTPINASIIMVGVPIAVLIFSQILVKEIITKRKLFRIILGSIGAIYLILNSGTISLEPGNFLGNLLVLANASSYALYLVLIKPVMRHYQAFTVMRWVFLFGAVYVIPITLPPALSEDWRIIPLNIWMSISYVVFFTTFLAYLFNNFSLRHINPTTNSVLIYLQPVFASLVAINFQKDQLTYQEVLAAMVIFAGVYFVISKPGKAVESLKIKHNQ